MALSFSHLLKEVESLKSENSHLRRELQDNSSHLSKLEDEASNMMKDVMSHLQLTMDGDEGDLDGAGDAEGVAEMPEGLAGEGPCGQNAVTSTADNSLCEANDSYEDNEDRAAWGEKGASAACSPANGGVPAADNRDIYTRMQGLDQERKSLMKEIETEEQHRKWFYRQLELITKKLETLPLTDTYNLQTDMARRQLEYEAQQLRGAMTDKLGGTEQSSQRQEARLQRLRSIETEMVQLQQQRQQRQQNHRTAPAAARHKDAGTTTSLTLSMFSSVPGQENGYVCDRIVSKAADGRQRTTVAVQTADVTLTQSEGQVMAGLAPGMPLGASASSMYHGAWPIHKDMGQRNSAGGVGDLSSVMSFNSTNTGSSGHSSVSSKQSPQQLGTKVEMVYSLLSMLGTHDKDDMSRTLLAMSSSQDSCVAMRQSGCLPLLIQLLHGSDKDSGLLGNTRGSSAARARASLALHNIVHSNPDDKRGRREARTLRLLEQIRAHCDQQRGESAEDEDEEAAGAKGSDIDHHPGPAIAALMKLSFDEDYRHAICTLGGLQAIAELLEVDHLVQGNTTEQYSVTVRRYACMALTNLTFGDGKNKALLCSMRPAMEALVAQLRSPNEDLCQGAASVLRNLSWRADLASKKTLREVGAVTTLMEAAMNVKKETTLKSILSALWNLSSHCSENKAEICAVRGALEFLVSLLGFKSQGKTHAITENGGGILRNVSSQIAVREDYRRILRKKGCLQTLLTQLRSTSLTIVSNACGTLWNLSARCAEDQQLLREMGAVGMLRNLVGSKHRMIAMGSSAALRNLLSSAGPGKGLDYERGANGNRPTLSVRKQRALEEELDQNLSETCENVESPRDSPTDTQKSDSDGRRFVYPYDATHMRSEDDRRRALHRRQVVTRCGSSDAVEGRFRSPQRVPRASSQDSVSSTHSDISHDRIRVQNMLAKSSHLLHRRQGSSLERKKEHTGMLHRVSSDNSCSLAAERHQKGLEASARPGQPSRIVQYMQEVAMFAGVDSNSNSQPSEAHLNKSHSANSMSKVGAHGLSYQSHTYPGMNDTQRVLYEHLAKNNVNISSDVVNLNYDREGDSDGSEEPVNYSLKYQDTSPNMYPEPSILAVNGVASVGPGSLHAQHAPGNSSGAMRLPNPRAPQFTANSRGPPGVRINNYMMPPAAACSSGMQPRHVPHMVHNRFPAPQGYPQHHQQLVRQQYRHRNIGFHQPIVAQLSAYAETDLDQPTDFSLRYAEEHSDDQEQPVNYSMRYGNDPDPHCVECKYEEARRANDRLDQSANDDQVLTFCTEGTPFLSNAPSLTDLTGKHEKEGDEKGETDAKVHDNEEEEEEEEGGDEIHNFSARYGESERTAGESSCDRHTASTVRPAASRQGHTIAAAQSAASVPMSFHSRDDDGIPGDQIKTYCEEGTPVCFSRVSSLSSLHSSEARDNLDQGRPVMLQSIDETEKADGMSTSVIENKNVGMKTALVDKDQRRNRGDAEREPKTVTFDENRQVEETPLMFSRCSSLGSLSSFDTQSVHSSVISEYSRRASEVVSPSELPDSPSETMPPSPTGMQSPPMKTFKPIVAGAEATRPAEGAAWHSDSIKAPPGDKTAQLLDMVRKFAPDSKTSDAVSLSGKSEVPVVYADEGTPPVFSETSSLSALTLELEGGGKANPDKDSTIVEQETNLSKIDEADVTLCENKNLTQATEDKDSSMSEVSEGEEEILAQCIMKAMPAPSSTNRKLRKSSSDNTIKKKSSLPKPEASPAPSKSRLPTKVGPTSSTPISKSSKPTPSKIGKPTKAVEPATKKTSPAANSRQSNNAAKPPRPAQSKPLANQPQRRLPAHSVPRDDDYAPDTLQTFATEGTPLNFSAATSLSDLSVVTSNEPATVVKASPPVHKSPPSADDSRSDNSSLCEESEQQLLTEMIQSAMPKSRAARKLELERSAQGLERKGATKQAVKGVSAPVQDKQGTKTQAKVCLPNTTADTLKTYATEGTPNNFSAATSLSDLTIDSIDDFGDQRSGKFSNPRSPSKSSSNQQSVSQGHNVDVPVCSVPDEAVFPGGAMDSPRVYGMEGTPITFSRNDSLSSLDMIEDKEEGRSGQATRDHASSSGGAEPLTFLHASERQVIGQSSEESSVISEKQPTQRSGKDEMKKFAVEGTPLSFSRNSSLSSLASGGRAREPQPEDEPQISRTSSFSSNSTESASFDPTPSEQALLDQCISAAMPKRRPSRGEEKSRRYSRSSKGDGGKYESTTVQEGGSLKTSALEIHADLDDQAAGNSLPLDLSTRGRERRTKLMTQSCSDALDMDTEGESGRESRFSSWRRHRQMSSDEMKHEKLPWARSHSQDNFIKMQKNISNKITQSSVDSSANSSSNSSSASTSRSGQPFLASASGSCSTSVIQVVAPAADNRLLDQTEEQTPAPRGREAVLMRDGSLLASFTDSSSSGEKADSEKSVFDDQNTSRESVDHNGDEEAEDMDHEDYEHNRTVLEITSVKERSVAREIAVGVEAAENEEEEESIDTPEIDSTLHYEEGLEEKLCFDNHNASFDQEDGVCESGHASFDQEITPEDERLLQENASLIVSEIVTKRDMTGSAYEEDIFIENETISLVSNDYTSDTASEVSVSWSTTSEKLSERSCSTVSQAETVGSGSARIVKPSAKKTIGKKGSSEEEEAKAVRGRRKPLYSNRSSTSSLKSVASSTKMEASSPSKARPNSGGTGNSRSPAAGNRGSIPAKKTPPKTQPGQTRSSLPGPKSSPQGTQKSGTGPASSKNVSPRSNLTKTQLPGQRPGSGSGIPRSPARGGNTPPSKLPTSRRQDGSTERPKPPSKQATFIKDAPAVSKTPPGTGNASSNVRLRTRSASRNRSQPDKRNSGGSGCAVNKRNSTGSPPEAWSKALDSFNFIVDKTGDNGFSQPYKQIQMQKNAKEAPAALKRSTVASGNKQQRPSNIARPQTGGTPARAAGKVTPSTAAGSKLGGTPSPGTKSNLPSRNNLNKSGSASSLRKAGSGSSLTKTSSGSSLNKGTTPSGIKKPGTASAGARADVKKSDSSASLRRASDGSRPSTPVGRRPSNPLPAKKTETAVIADEAKPELVAKKQIPTKVASTWRKEEASSRDFDPPIMSAPRPKPSKSSSLPAYTRAKPWSSQTWVRKSSSGHSTNSSSEDQSGSSLEIIPRSSTYDKFPSQCAAPESSDEHTYTSDGLVSSGNAVYELCDPSSGDFEGSESQNSDCVNLDEAYIQDDSEAGNADDTMLTCSVDSLEEAENNNASLMVPPSTIDSSTWRKKARPSKDGDVSLPLPNADETCRSMCSFVSFNESQNESFARPVDSSIWQKHIDDSTLSEVSFASNATAGGKKSKSKKSVAKSIKSFLSGPKFFGSKQSKDQAKLRELNEKSEKSFISKSSEAPKTSTASTGTTTLAKTISIPTSKPSPAAVVAPFNYSPPSGSQISATTPTPTILTVSQVIPKDASSNKDATSDAPQKGAPVVKHMTKTEMLLARRRRSNLNSQRSEEDGLLEDDTSQRGCMVTTV